MVANAEPGRILADFQDLDTEFMAEDSGVGEKRLTTSKGVQIGPTDPDSMDLDKRLAGFDRDSLRTAAN